MNAATIESKDGTKLAARVYEPDSPDRGNVVIGGAMGVRQDYYAPFAQWLATQGWRVTTFDYRGSGESAPKSLRGFRADLFDWARDYEAAVDHAHAALPDRPLYLLGHSLGAQLPGLLNNQHKISGMLSVAAGSGYWLDMASHNRLRSLYLWFIAVPLATWLFGYFPGRKMRKIGDLPTGVVMQWRKWCLSPRYSVSAEGEWARQGYATARYPVRALSITDDELMTLRCTSSLMALYENAPRAVERIAPADAGVRRLGHFGAFRREHEKQLWPRLAQWLAGLNGLGKAA